MELNRVHHRGRDLQKAAADEEDRLSKLPDDVLINILDRVDTLDAIRTCILSKKLQNLLSKLSRIVILLSRLDLFRMNHVVADVTDKLLRTRSPQVTIRRLKVRFMLRPDDCLSIGKSVAFAMATQKLDAAEFEITTETYSNHCTTANLHYIAKQFDRFLGDCPDAFAGLTRLHLQNMNFGDMPKILSTCQRLESLRLFQCNAGIHSVLKIEHARLVELDIASSVFKTLELSFLPKLERLAYERLPGREDALVLGFVPRLSKLFFASNTVVSEKTLLLSDLLANAPSISDLHLYFQYEEIWVRPERPKLLTPVLRKVRVVNLENLREGCDIAWTMFILEAAPSLEELCVTVHGHKCPIDFIFSKKTDVMKWEPSAADLKHKNLAKLTIHGFQSDSNFMGYVRRIMEAAVNIKEVSLHDSKVCRSCTSMNLDINDLSSYPRTGEEMDLLRKKISEGLVMASPAVIHFRPSCYDTLEVKYF